MFFGGFSQIFRGDDVFLKNEKPSNVLMMAGNNVAISLVCRYDSGFTRFFVGAFSMNSLQDFDGKIIRIGGAPELKKVEILVRK